MGAAGYESWFISARDPDSPRALWIRHTRHRPRQGTESAALWCTLIDRDLARPPIVVKQVFDGFPSDAAAGPGQFRGQAAIGAQTWLGPDCHRRGAHLAAIAAAGLVPGSAAAYQA
jgi:hypothetical protein